MEYSTNSNGRLLNPQLHDGHLQGLMLGPQSTLNLHLSDVAKNGFVFALAGLGRLLVDEFREGNIILDVTILRGIAPERSELERLIGTLHPSVGTPFRDQHEAAITGYSDRVATGELTFLRIVPSYGSDLLALCVELRIDAV